MIPKDEWLPQAERLPVGQSKRVRHNFERDCSMTVSNKHDRYWAYCQRCKDGGVHMKEYVRLDQPTAIPQPYHGVPADALPLLECRTNDQYAVYQFLTKKGCPPPIIPPNHVWYSATARRIIFRAPEQGATARALTDHVLPKWLDMEHSAWYAPQGKLIEGWYVLTEDVLSAYKVAWADPSVRAVCTHGTSIRPALLMEVLSLAKGVLIMYDGDDAGYKGAARVRTELRSMGVPHVMQYCAPTGMDPKDMQHSEIQQYIRHWKGYDGPASTTCTEE